MGVWLEFGCPVLSILVRVSAHVRKTDCVGLWCTDIHLLHEIGESIAGFCGEVVGEIWRG